MITDMPTADDTAVRDQPRAKGRSLRRGHVQSRGARYTDGYFVLLRFVAIRRHSLHSGTRLEASSKNLAAAVFLNLPGLDAHMGLYAGTYPALRPNTSRISMCEHNCGLAKSTLNYSSALPRCSAQRMPARVATSMLAECSDSSCHLGRPVKAMPRRTKLPK